MGTGYTKVFGDMLESTVWQLSKDARILWITLLLKKDRRQMVRASIPGLAHVARLTIEETEKALRELQKPDKYSQSQEHEGRRILKTDEGWFVVNGAKYRDKLSYEDRLEYQRTKQAEYRAKKKGKKLPGENLFEKAAERGDQESMDRISSPDFIKEQTNGQRSEYLGED